MPKLSLNCHHYALLAVLMWSTPYTFTRIVMASYSSGSLSLIRNGVGAVILLALVLVLKRGLPERRDWPWFGLAGLTGLGLYTVLFNQGTFLAGAATSCIIIAAAPIITAILASILFREKIRPAGWIAIAIGFCGIVVMTLWRGTIAVITGVFWLLAAAFSLSCYVLVQRGLSRRYDSLTITAYAFVASAIMLSVELPGAVRAMAAAPPAHTALALYMGVFPSALAYLSWVKALALAPKTSVVTNYMFLTPILAMLFDHALTGDTPHAGIVIGGAMVLTALALFAALGK